MKRRQWYPRMILEGWFTQWHRPSCQWATCGCAEWHRHRQWLPWWDCPTLHLLEWPTASDEVWYALPSNLWMRCRPTQVPADGNKFVRNETRIITKRRQENLKIGGGTWFRAYLMPLGLVISCVALQRLAVASFTTIAQNCDKRFPSAHANKHGVTRNPGPLHLLLLPQRSSIPK